MAALRRRRSVSSSQRVRGLLATADCHSSNNFDTDTKRENLHGENGNVSPEFNNVKLPDNNVGFRISY